MRDTIYQNLNAMSYTEIRNAFCCVKNCDEDSFFQLAAFGTIEPQIAHRKSHRGNYSYLDYIKALIFVNHHKPAKR